MDVRVGGRWRHCLRSTETGAELWHGGVFREVVPPRAAGLHVRLGRGGRARHRERGHDHVHGAGQEDADELPADAVPVCRGTRRTSGRVGQRVRSSRRSARKRKQEKPHDGHGKESDTQAGRDTRDHGDAHLRRRRARSCSACSPIAKHLAAWWGPHGFTNPVCEVDARPSGTILHPHARAGRHRASDGRHLPRGRAARAHRVHVVRRPAGRQAHPRRAQHRHVRGAQRPHHGHRARARGRLCRLRGAACSPAWRPAGRRASTSSPATAAHETGAKDADDQDADPRDLRRPHQRAVRQGASISR